MEDLKRDEQPQQSCDIENDTAMQESAQQPQGDADCPDTDEAAVQEQPATDPELVMTTDESDDRDSDELTAEEKRRAKKYRYHFTRDEYYDALLSLDVASGRHGMYRNISFALLIIALIGTIDFSLTRNLLAAIAAGTLMVLGIWIRNIDKRNAKKMSHRASPKGTTFTLEIKKQGLMVHDNVNKPMLMPYSMFKRAYEHTSYLSLITSKNASLNIKRDNDNPAYLAICERFKQELGEHYKPEKPRR